MKKRFCAILISLIFVFTLTGCDRTYRSSSSDDAKQDGSYFCYNTDDTEKYLNFLENFDYETYEILDISSYASHNWWVTYKLKNN